MPEAKVTTSKQWTLDLRDLGKGALVAAITSLVLFIYNWSISDLDFSEINWQSVIKTAVAAFAGYLIKNFVEPTKTVIVTNPDDAKVTLSTLQKVNEERSNSSTTN